jgi:hypothetical protein
MGPRLLYDNCTITVIGQSKETDKTVDLSQKVHLLKKDIDYINIGSNTSMIWLLDPDPKWSLTPSTGVNDVANEFLQINITVQEGNPILPVDPAIQQSVWSKPPQIYLLDKSKTKSPLDLNRLETYPWIYAKWNRINYARYSEKHALRSDESYSVVSPTFTVTDVPFPRDKKRIELVITPDLPITDDGKQYLIETYRPYRNYDSSNFLESVLLIVAIAIIALLAIFNIQNSKSVSINTLNTVAATPSSFNQRETRVTFNQPNSINNMPKTAQAKPITPVQETVSQNHYSVPSVSPPAVVGQRSVDLFSTGPNVASSSSLVHHANEPTASRILNESSELVNESSLSESSESLAQPKIAQDSRYRYTAYSVRRSEDWLMNSQYHEGNQSEISIDISDGDIAIAKHAVLRSAVSTD